ncbi:hypothetical protein SDC9_136337 [bioreactor metagenome]|uniref:ECF transporter S component n=2 Tax=root TaxID=1 RepID=A0A645DIV9_9ZZZZ
MVAGGIGSAMADILGGYSHWALFTLIIKGFEGYFVGIIIKNSNNMIRTILATVVGTLIMVVGYFLAGIILKGSVIISAGSIPSNLVQGIISMILAIPLSYSLNKVKYVKTLKVNF